MNKWQPIETAPKDGTPILCFTDRDKDIGFLDGGILTLYASHLECTDEVKEALYDGIHVCEYGGGWSEYDDYRGTNYGVNDYWFVYGTEFTVIVYPTHWMPLPEPPK